MELKHCRDQMIDHDRLCFGGVTGTNESVCPMTDEETAQD